jgi:hypothetical protein
MQFAHVNFSSIQFCIAVLAERVQYRVATHYRLRLRPLRSRERRISDQKANQSQKQRSAALCRCLGPQYCNRSFGCYSVWKVARGWDFVPCRRNAKNRRRPQRARWPLRYGDSLIDHCRVQRTLAVGSANATVADCCTKLSRMAAAPTAITTAVKQAMAKVRIFFSLIFRNLQHNSIRQVPFR